jgi:hypothetical protein
MHSDVGQSRWFLHCALRAEQGLRVSLGDRQEFQGCVLRAARGEGFFDCMAAVPQERDAEKGWPPFRSE